MFQYIFASIASIKHDANHGLLSLLFKLLYNKPFEEKKIPLKIGSKTSKKFEKPESLTPTDICVIQFEFNKMFNFDTAFLSLYNSDPKDTPFHQNLHAFTHIFVGEPESAITK